MKKINFGKATVFHSEGNKDLASVKRAVINAERKNERLYGVKAKPYKLILCDSKKHYKEVVGKGGGDMGACYKFGKLFFVTPSERKEMNVGDYSFYHEINHVFYNKIAKTYKPVWFGEALANLAQNTYKPSQGWKRYLRAQPNNGRKLMSETFHFDLKKNHELYTVSYFCGRWLEKKYGLKKVFGFVKKIPSPYNNRIFWKRFERYFGLTREELVKEALR